MHDLEVTTNPPPKRIDPAQRRLSGVPAVPIVLSDSQTWYFAAAVEKMRPEFEGDRFIGVMTYRGFPPRAQPFVAELLFALDREEATARHVYGTATALLRAACNLSSEEATELLTLPVERINDLTDALKRAINGEVPPGDPLAASIEDHNGRVANDS